MEEARKNTYKDWWEGSALLNTSHSYVLQSEEHLINCMKWEELETEEANKIRQKQNELFDEAVAKHLHEWKDHFLLRHSNSQLPDLLIEVEIQKAIDLISGDFPLKPDLYLQDYGLRFTDFYLDHVQKHIGRYIIGGEVLSKDFVSSPNFKVQKSEIPYQVYATVLFGYYMFLKSFHTEKDSVNKDFGEVIGIQCLNEEWYPQIFKNVHAFNMYKKLIKLTAKATINAADVGYVFNKLKDKKLGAIHKTVSQGDFIAFIFECEGIKIKAEKFHYNLPKYKEQHYNVLVNEFQALISPLEPRPTLC